MSEPAPRPGPPALRPRVALTIGKLDGVHAGHRWLLAGLVATADRLGCRSAVVVLHPDPATVLAGRRVPQLSSVAERARRIRAFGVDEVRVLGFDPALAALSPAAFVDRLEAELELAAVVVGPDFAFGRGRSGDHRTLTALGRERGFEVAVVAPLTVGGEKLGSRAIRGMVEAGDIDGATTALRHGPWLAGTVVRGAARGRTLGFPTANLAPSGDWVLPANGVYTVRASWPGGTADGLASVGVRPTFDHGERLVEVYLLDFEGDLYGQELAVEILERQRGEERYDSAAALIAQMRLDEARARATLARLAAPGWTALADGGARARGRDLAALCQRLGEAWLASSGGPLPGAAARRVPVALEAPDEAGLVAAWMARLAAAGRGGARAEVFQAGAGALHALVAESAAGGPGSASARAWRALGPVSRSPDGEWTAEAGPV